MAKAADIPVDPFEPYAAAGARSVRVRARELFEQADGVLDTGDIERVHAMRVTSRRLRAVLEVFAPCFDKAAHSDVLRDVKRLADALGERRDPDVHIAAMTAFAGAVAREQRPGVETFAAHIRERQAAGNVALAAELQRIEQTDLAGRLRALADTAAPPEEGDRPAPIAELPPGDGAA
ncbi:MAG TPA: CHAD domain-containing protein [Solirubrobacteraceae bacterium]|jgi:CHAD domain-containing protein